MISKRYDQITKEDIEELISNGISENRTLEYKEQLPGGKDRDKKEFLADISSFANASGGYILYGISEKRNSAGNTTGIPESAEGLTEINIDAEIRRMDNLIANCIEPRIVGIRIQAIYGFKKGPIIIIFIPKSWMPPHMVTFKTTSRFYSRNNTGKYPLDVMEIRSAFLFSETFPEKIRRFRDNRIAKIIADETPITLNSSSKIVLHILPVSSITPLFQIDLRSEDIIKKIEELAPIYSMGWDHRYNLDGFLNYNRSNSYVQVFRNGAIESVDTSLLTGRNGEKFIPSGVFENEIIMAVKRSLKTERDLSFEPPIFILLSILGAKDYRMAAGKGDYYKYKTSINDDILILPETVIDSFDDEIPNALRASFDALWQAADWPYSLNYDTEGNWIGEKL
ncbi:MAG: ATP-binding protein [Methanotrichaceae archaeon]|nr:ATP-binding protein [Methanotrichaceae archaeon]